MDDIEMIMDASDDKKEVTLTLTSHSEIDIQGIILTLESYLMELTRAEADKRKPGVELH